MYGRFTKIETLCEWLESEAPREPFTLRPGVLVTDPDRWKQHLLSDLRDHTSPRWYTGAVQDDVFDLFKVLGISTVTGQDLCYEQRKGHRVISSPPP